MSKRVGVASLVVILAATPLVIRHEGMVLRTYVDPVGIKTACIGETDKAITDYRSVFTRDECVAVMGASLYRHALEVDRCITRLMTQGQAVAVLSLSYNIGTGAFCASTLVRKLNAGQPFCDEFTRWNKAGGRVLPGLVKRRAEERALCEGRA